MARIVGTNEDDVVVVGSLPTNGEFLPPLTATNLADEIDNGAGNDTIDASSGDDVIIGGNGDDTMVGGLGDDRYIFNLLSGSDRIQEKPGEGIDGF